MPEKARWCLGTRSAGPAASGIARNTEAGPHPGGGGGYAFKNEFLIQDLIEMKTNFALNLV